MKKRLAHFARVANPASNKKKSLLTAFLIPAACIVLSSCAQPPKVGIREVNFTVQDNKTRLSTDLSASPDGKKVAIRAPYGTDLHSLKPEISFFGNKLIPPSGQARDFSHPITYTVKGSSGSKTYTLAVVPDAKPNLFPVAGDGVKGVVLKPILSIPDGGGRVQLTVPPDYKKSGKKYPLHLHFHGLGGDLYGTGLKFPFNDVVGTPGREFIMATWAGGDFDLRRMLDYLLAHYPIDRNHIWISGHSTGAYTVLSDICELPKKKYPIEVTMVMSSPLIRGCTAGKYHFIISGSYDLVPFFSHSDSEQLYDYFKKKLQCSKEALLDARFAGYPYEVRRRAAYDCQDRKQVYFYTLEKDFHNPHLSRNLINNIMVEIFRSTGLTMIGDVSPPPPGDHYAILRPSAQTALPVIKRASNQQTPVHR